MRRIRIAWRTASALVIIMRLLGMTISVSALTAFASQRFASLASVALGAQVVDPSAAITVCRPRLRC